MNWEIMLHSYITGQFKHFSGQILEDSCQIDALGQEKKDRLNILNKIKFSSSPIK